MSQLLLKIEADLRSTATPSDRGKLLARKSAYLARIGKFEDSKSIVCDLRRDFGNSRSSNVTIWIMLTEGLIHYYENLGLEAYDRIVRAQLLSKAIGDEELAATTSAWRAHLEFERSDFRAMAASLESTFKFMAIENYAAQTRVSMVLSDCHFLCGDRAGGQKWFLRSRDTALKEGDQASIEALLYNKAAFALAWLRAQRCFGPIAPDQLSLLRLELSSARNLQDMAGINALTHVVHLCEARLLLLEEKYEEGISKLQSVRNAAPYGEYNFNQSLIDLEIEYCRHRLKPNEARSSNPKWDFDALDIDEQMLAAWMIGEIYSNSSEASEVEGIDRRLTEKKIGYSRTLTELRSILEAFADA
jgi:hypothetical protein